MKREAFDIYKLGGNEGKGSIRAVMNPKLKEQIDKAIDRLEYRGFYSKLCKLLNIKYYQTLWKYLKKANYIPLFVLKELEKLSQINLRENIQYLEYGTGNTKRKTKLVTELDENFASLIGAFIADGHLKERGCKWGDRKAKHYELIFREEYKSNMDALAKWINNVFEIGIKPKKEKNHYSIYISNKIVFRYFHNILGFKSGRKTETVTIPEIFYSASREIKVAVIKGVLMFDGSVSRKTRYIELYSKSQGLIKGVENLFVGFGITPGYVSSKPDKYQRHRIIIRKHSELKKSLIFFEKDTEKYERLQGIIETFKR